MKLHSLETSLCDGLLHKAYSLDPICKDQDLWGVPLAK